MFSVYPPPLVYMCAQAQIKIPSIPTVKALMKCVLHLKPRAIEALRDITHLPGRESKDRDLEDSPGGLHFSRITQVAFHRDEFAELEGEEQAAYLYRIAGYGSPYKREG